MKKKNIIIGIDEVGRGCLAGPVIAVACSFDYEQKIPNEILLNVKDSKQMTKRRREVVFDNIIEYIKNGGKAIRFGLGVVDNYIIDEINIRQATKLAMERALDELFLKIKKTYIKKVLIDGRDNFVFKHKLKGLEYIIKGDTKHIEIKLASVLAKVFRDKLISLYDDIYPEFNFSKHKGYGTRAHRDIIKKNKLKTSIHRKSFKLKN